MRERIRHACRRANRDEAGVTLMAVSKQQPAEAMLQAAALGVTLFGENRVQEFAVKSIALGEARSAMQVQMIGHLQSNKAHAAVELFDGVHSVDSLRLARLLNDEAAALGKRLACWVEIKLSDEPSKSGFEPAGERLYDFLEAAPQFTCLSWRGLMTVPRWSEDPNASRQVFASLRDLRDQIVQRYPRVPLEGLSMGMSHDFESAIEEGSTLVRVGTDIFGPRPKPGAVQE